ncbi:MAG: hypothetical protein IIA59_03045 [Candidatus Marinimicrobia bacterium]|nr:hypothetical protein [Candidatus Neomarinimicrobiota bacterium]
MREPKYLRKIMLVTLLAVVAAHGQRTGRLSQKLLLENTIQQRVTNAMSKILDESQFVVDVRIDLAFAPDASSKGTVMRGADGRFSATQATGDANALPESSRDATTGATSNPFPIPGFPNMDALRNDESVRVLEDADAADDEQALDDVPPSELDMLEGQSLFPDNGTGLPQIKAMSLNIILEDGVSPQTIENVRQVALVASRYDRDRGDILSITTASFKDRRPGRRFASDISADELLAQSSAGKQITEENEELRETLREARQRNEELMQEIRNREMEYLQQSESERKQALSDLASVQNERAKDLIFLQQQREESNLKIQEALLQQIDGLRQEMTSGILSQREQNIKTVQATSLEDTIVAMRIAFEREKDQLQAQIEAALNPAPAQPQGLGGFLDGPGLIIVGFIFFLLLLALLVTMVVRNRAPVPAMGYGAPYPPRRKKRRPKSKPKEATPVEATPVEAAPVAEPDVVAMPGASAVVAPEEEVEWSPQAPPGDNPDVLQAELKSIRQSVVSMTVGQQNTASRILSDWLSSDPGEPSEGAPSAEEEAASGNGESEGDEG